MGSIRFLDILLNVLFPILVAGVAMWVLSRPNAPLDADMRGAAKWVILVLLATWIIYFLWRLLSGGYAVR